MTIIETKELEFGYVTRDEKAKVTEMGHTINGVSPQIGAGSLVAILGHNNSGRPILAKAPDGILLPSGDTALTSGVNTVNDAKLLGIHREAGVVSQNLDNQVTANPAGDDMGLSSEDLGVPTEETQQRMGAALKAVGTTVFRLKSPNHLSGGQKQRVAIAGVTAMHPKCIVPDEPATMLGPDGRKEVIRTVAELSRSEGIAVMLIIHYTEEVIGADRLVVMDDGKVVMDETPWEIFARVEESKRLRLDVPQATELTYGLKQRGINSPDNVFAMEELAEAILPLWKES